MKFLLNIILLILIFQVTICFSQIEISNNLNDYLKIKVFESAREDIEEIFGKPVKSYQDGHIVDYLLPNGMRVSVDYSQGLCKYGNSDWNVPEWIVTEIQYSPLKKRPKLRELLKSRIKFKRKVHGTVDVPDHIEYFNEEKGISILFDKAEGGEGVMDIIIRPSQKDKEKYDCDNLKNPN